MSDLVIFNPDAERQIIPASTLMESLTVRRKVGRMRTAEDSR